MNRLIKTLLYAALLAQQLPASALAAELLADHNFGASDAILVVDQAGTPVFRWQPQKLLVPASLTKLLTTHLAIEKWGLQHRFHTDFYQRGRQLWVKGYGDPFLISEEFDLIAAALHKRGITAAGIDSISIDNSYLSAQPVPGRSTVDDPYNAPISAVAANFNTVKLQRLQGSVVSAEAQTPITATAVALGKNVGVKPTRINLRNSSNAQRYFGELLAEKASLSHASIHIDSRLPPDAKLLYRHYNSHDLADMLRGALEYSNNFIANLIYLKLADDGLAAPVSFDAANRWVSNYLQTHFGWQGHQLLEGSGLSRSNRVSAAQLEQILSHLEPNKDLFRKVDSKSGGAVVFAKTGTLDGVRSYAGFIELAEQSYRFVFLLNRKVAYGYRDALLEDLIRGLQSRATVAGKR